MRYDGHIGKGHEPRPQTINHNALALRRGVGGNSSWHGIGEVMSGIRRTQRKPLLRRSCLHCPTPRPALPMTEASILISFEVLRVDWPRRIMTTHRPDHLFRIRGVSR